MNINVVGKNVQADSVQLFAIENDNLTEDVVFVFDRYQGSTDLSVLFGYIVYSNRLGTRAEILTTKIVGDKVYATWKIGRAVTSIPGRFDFCITFSSSSDPETIPQGTKTWSTKTNFFTVLEGLTSGEYAIPTEPIIVQMLAQVSDIQAQINALSLLVDDINGEVI